MRGFTDALRSELMHDGLEIQLAMVHLPALNTPQFDWALNKMAMRAQPVPPIFQPEVAAEAILFATQHRRREVWVGMLVVKTIVANKLWPGLLDRLLVKLGYAGQLTGEPQPADTPSNLFVAVPGEIAAHGRFDATARSVSAEFMLSRYRSVAVAGAVLMGVIAVLGFRTRNRQ